MVKNLDRILLEDKGLLINTKRGIFIFIGGDTEVLVVLQKSRGSSSVATEYECRA